MTFKSTGNERCSNCDLEFSKGQVVIEGEGGSLHCSASCQTEDEDDDLEAEREGQRFTEDW